MTRFCSQWACSIDVPSQKQRRWAVGLRQHGGWNGESAVCPARRWHNIWKNHTQRDSCKLYLWGWSGMHKTFLIINTFACSKLLFSGSVTCRCLLANVSSSPALQKLLLYNSFTSIQLGQVCCLSQNNGSLIMCTAMVRHRLLLHKVKLKRFRFIVFIVRIISHCPCYVCCHLASAGCCLTNVT